MYAKIRLAAQLAAVELDRLLVRAPVAEVQ